MSVLQQGKAQQCHETQVLHSWSRYCLVDKKLKQSIEERYRLASSRLKRREGEDSMISEYVNKLMTDPASFMRVPATLRESPSAFRSP